MNRFLGKNLFEAYDEIDDEARMEEQLGVSKTQWLEICENVFDNEFTNKRFTDILNNRIVDLI